MYASRTYLFWVLLTILDLPVETFQEQQIYKQKNLLVKMIINGFIKVILKRQRKCLQLI